jgi:signal transduction histidine kinase
MSTENDRPDEKSGVPPAESSAPAGSGLPYRDDFIRVLLALAKDFINIPLGNMHAAFDEAMALIAGYCDADRITGFHYDLENSLARRHYTWDRVPGQGPGAPETLTLAGREAALECHRQGRIYIGNCPEGLPGGSPIGSLCSYPVFMEGRLRGAIVLSTVGRQKNWTADEIDAIQILCEMASSVMLRLDEETRYRESRETLEKETLKNAVLEKEKALLSEKERELLKSEEALRESERRALALVRELERTEVDLTEEIEALRRLHLISSEYLLLSDLVYIYDEILDAAIDLTHADKGYIQIYVEQEDCLKIINQRGFGEQYLKYFAVVASGRLVSGRALKNRERVVFQPTEDLSAYSETELRLIRSEEVGGAQSTPIISSTGVIYGMLNTHYKTRRGFTKRELVILDLLARMAADFIERKRSEVALAVSEKNATALVSALQKADRSKNEFLNQLSHELRNPLATINAAITLIDMSDDIGQIRETNAIIKSETKQLNHLIDDLLDVTRITTNKIKIKKRLMNLSETVLSSANNFRPQFSQKNVSFDAQADEAPIFLHADPARIMQIIENLLMNALTYTDEGGAVTLSLKRVGENAVISVEDNGIGIKPEELPMLFNAFYQAEKSRNRPDSGLGLGLAIVKGMAELHGGTVSAYSKGIGFGSLFTVSLPLDAGPAVTPQNTEQ